MKGVFRMLYNMHGDFVPNDDSDQFSLLMWGGTKVRALVGKSGFALSSQPCTHTYVNDIYVHMPSVVGHTCFIHDPGVPPGAISPVHIPSVKWR